MVADRKPQQRKREESDRLRGERDKIKFIILYLKDGKFENSGKQEEGKTFHKLHFFGMNDNLWDKVHGLGSKKTQRYNSKKSRLQD